MQNGGRVVAPLVPSIPMLKVSYLRKHNNLDNTVAVQHLCMRWSAMWAGTVVTECICVVGM